MQREQRANKSVGIWKQAVARKDAEINMARISAMIERAAKTAKAGFMPKIFGGK